MKALYQRSCRECGADISYWNKNKIRCPECANERTNARARMRYWVGRERNLARHKNWYIKNRKDNPIWREENKRRAKAWRAKQKRLLNEYQRV